MHDTCEILGNSQIQHGPFSNRIYLMKLERRDLPEIVLKLERLATRHGYTKIFAKIPADAGKDFLDSGYRREASIPGFYQGRGEALFLGKYLDPARARAGNREELENVLELAKSRACREPQESGLPAGFTFFGCGSGNIEEMSRLYREVFPSYPFPIHDPGYLRETMESHVDYFGILRGSRLVSLASSEMDVSGSSVEMTDFATLPDFRGRGLARFLLQEMEEAMVLKGMMTAYTIARAVSPGMNITFSRRGYHHGGTLINKTQISGSIESMNIWSKSLRPATMFP